MNKTANSCTALSATERRYSSTAVGFPIRFDLRGYSQRVSGVRESTAPVLTLDLQITRLNRLYPYTTAAIFLPCWYHRHCQVVVFSSHRPRLLVGFCG